MLDEIFEWKGNIWSWSNKQIQAQSTEILEEVAKIHSELTVKNK